MTPRHRHTTGSPLPEAGQATRRPGRPAHSGPVGEPLRLVLLTLPRAAVFVAQLDRHHPPPRGAWIGLGLARGEHLVAVAVLGDPVPPAADDGMTVEITRTACHEHDPPTLVALYQHAWRVAHAHGYQHLITHTPPAARAVTHGLRQLGLRPVAGLPPRATSHTPWRARTDRGVDGVCRTRWELRSPSHVRHDARPGTAECRTHSGKGSLR